MPPQLHQTVPYHGDLTGKEDRGDSWELQGPSVILGLLPGGISVLICHLQEHRRFELFLMPK